MAGLPARLPVLPPLALGLLPGPPGLFRPDPLLRRRGPGIGAVHAQAPLQLRQPQPEPPDQLPVGIPPGPQPLDLRGLRLHHRTLPRIRSAKPRSVVRHGLIGHATQAPTPAATPQIDKQRTQPGTRAQQNPANSTP